MRRMGCIFCIALLSVLLSSPAFCVEAVNVMLKNNSSATVEAELIDQYGGNFKASVDGGMSQNHTLKINSEIKVNNTSVHVVVPEDEGKEVVIAGS